MMPIRFEPRLFRLFLVVLVLIGSALRFHRIEKPSFWSDELFTLSIATYHPLLPEKGQPWYRATSLFFLEDGDTFITAKAGEQHPPLQDLLEKISVNVLGVSEFSARLPGALASCFLLAWFAWLAARTCDPWERRVLTWGLLMLVVSPALLIYAQDARAYSLGTSLIGMGGVLWLLRWKNGWRHVVPPSWLEITFFCLACYCHYNAAALVALLLLPDAVLACKKWQVKTLIRLSALTATFLVWVLLNAHTIVSTANGGVAWGRFTALESVYWTFRGSTAVMHKPWFWAVVLVACAMTARAFLLRHQRPLAPFVPRLFFLLGLIVVYIALAGTIVAKAGMLHARFYIFIVPIFMVTAAVLLAEVRILWLSPLLAILIVVTALPVKRPIEMGQGEDFRSMTRAAVEGSDNETLFLFPWRPNRNTYRIYLEQFLGVDSRSRMVAVSSTEDFPSVCSRIAPLQHVAIMGHDSGKQVMAQLYATCGAPWPHRQHLPFHNTFVEHWRKDAPSLTTARP